ncbi:MAG: hypothetical protein QGG40_16680, partial [Myxococcota bacterium]|nr:hypothetical protein [Myxococcota bacterium]
MLAPVLTGMMACKAEETPPAPATESVVTCHDGVESRAWQDAQDDDALYATVADITIETTEGDWNLSESWTGCDVHLFVQDEPNQASGWPTDLWDRDVDDLFDALPENVHIFFVSTDSQTDDREEIIATMQEEVAEVLADLSSEEQEHWQARVHFTLDRDRKLDGWLGDTLQSPGWGTAIDRFQRIRYIGSYADYDRYNSSYGWFEPNLSMVANEAVHYNFEAVREAGIEADGATVVNIFEESYVSGNVYAEVELPDAETMAGFDTLTLDLYMGCDGEGEYGDCPAWDYMAYLFQCDLPDAENPYPDESCQPYVAEVMGECHADGVASGTECREASDCGTQRNSDSGAASDTAGAGTDSGTGSSDSGSEDSGTTEEAVDWTCEGYEVAIEADTLTGTCTTPLGETEEETYGCNEEGTGYDDLECDCDTELGRWITTYHREGRWVHDVSGLLPMLEAGGSQRYRFNTTGPYLLDLDLRLSDQGKSERPEELTFLFSGGYIGPSYNEGYEALEIEVPAEATRVELATVISGHGMADPGNCAE